MTKPSNGKWTRLATVGTLSMILIGAMGSWFAVRSMAKQSTNRLDKIEPAVRTLQIKQAKNEVSFQFILKELKEIKDLLKAANK